MNKQLPERLWACTCGQNFPTYRKLMNHIKRSVNAWPLKGSTPTNHEAVSDLAPLSDAISQRGRKS